jgi:hypothetical protein
MSTPPVLRHRLALPSDVLSMRIGHHDDHASTAGFIFRNADAHGLNLGRAVGTNAWTKPRTYIQGLAAG